MSTHESQISYLPLFDPPRSRNLDPVSSHRAEEKLKRSGVMGQQAQEVLLLLKQYPGCTSKELAAWGGKDRHMVARRLPDLRDRNLVYETGRGTGEQVRWWPERRRVVRVVEGKAE